MPCYTTHDANGDPVGILCGELGPTCVECGDVSEVLCDFPISDEQRTCDKPLCERCAPTVGADKNYCREHRELGPGLLLFRGRPLTQEEMHEQAKAVWRAARDIDARRPAKRLPKRPPPGLEWCVARDGERASAWMSETGAARHRYRYGGEVWTWGRFVLEFRKKHPLKRDRPQPTR